MARFVDGFVVPIPKKNAAAYRAVACNAGKIWRKHRDRVNAKVMQDPRLASMMDPTKAIFDAARMIYGGFEVAVDR